MKRRMMFNRYLAISILLVPLLGGLTGCSRSSSIVMGNPFTKNQLAHLTSYVQSQMKTSHVPGAAIAVVAHGKIIYFKGLGVANVKTKSVPTENTIFAMGSLTKSLTATAILQLRNKGLLNLNDPIQKYLPWFRIASKPESNEVTLYELLTQSSGLPRVSSDKVYETLQDSHQHSIEAGVRALADVPLTYPPGSSWSYSNSNYAILGLIIQAVTHEPYADYMESHVLAPLGMSTTTFNVSKADKAKLAGKYVFFSNSSDPYAVNPAGEDMVFEDPAGSRLVSTVRDVAKYISFELGDGPTSVLPKSSISEAHTNGVEVAPSESYAYGWFEVSNPPTPYYWHDGATVGSLSLIVLDPAKDAGHRV